MIRRYSLMVLLVVVGHTSAPRPAAAQSRPAPADSAALVAGGSILARLTSLLVGKWSVPVCNTQPPAGEFLWIPNGDYCQWKTEARGTIGVQRDERRHVIAVTVNRNTNSKAEARAIIDSVDTAVRSWGLNGRECAAGSAPAGSIRSWLFKGSESSVHISEITPSSGPPRLLIIATEDPTAVPEAICRAT
jgi:hypothetical protein